MATSNGPVMSRRAASGKQHTRPIVPALPLPYVRRQASAAAAAAAAPAVGARSSPSDSAAGSKDTVGAVQRQPESTSVQSPTSTESSVTYAKNNSASSSREPTHANFRANGHGPPPVVSSAGKSGTAAVDIRGVQDANVKHDGAQQAVKPVQQFLPAGLSEPVVTIFGAAAKDGPQSQADGHYPVQAPDARLQSAVSPTSYQMPPPFQPASRPLGIVGNGDMARGTRPHPQNGPHPIHQAHPSNGSIHFGTFHESQSSSPAPPLSGGIAPPPGITGPDGRPAYMGHAGNGFPPMMPYGSDVMPIGNFDNYGRPAVGYGHMETHPAYGSNYAPSTPHSFHDSQSSGHPEDNSMYGPFPPASQRNSAALSGDDARAQNPQRMFGPPDYSGMHMNMGPPHLMSHGDHSDGIVGYLQHQFALPNLADCTLELRFPNEQAQPVRMPAHRLILCRSAKLTDFIQKQNFAPNDSKGPSSTIVLHADKWMPTEAFLMAVQRLYGLPLLPIPPHNRADSGDLVEAGSAREQFEFSLSYADAGRILGWVPVVRRGCEIAAHLLGWQTMERALEFALEEHSDKGTHDSFKYGDGSRVILDALGSFIVHNVPPSFNVDLSAEEPKTYTRLPVRLPPPSTPPPTSPELNSPSSPRAASREQSVQLGKGRRSQQMVHIQFGDLSLSESRNGSDSETPKANQQATPVSHAILSRILLNLPFTNLKMMLDSAPGNATAWANAEVRHRIIGRAVKGREARRLRILEAIADGNVVVPGAVRVALRSPTPQDVGRWSSLGWQEEMMGSSGPEGVVLVRKWVPLMETQNGSSGAYP